MPPPCFDRIDLRRGLSVVLGCFILFGAPTIVKGLRGVGNGAISETHDADVPRSSYNSLHCNRSPTLLPIIMPPMQGRR
jgi:hypothetical protein